MQIEWSKIAPVLVSIGIIIGVAILRNYSKTIAAVAAVMPINIPLALWILAAGDSDSPSALADITVTMTWNLLPTVLFLIVVMLLLRAGWTLLPAIVAGYVAWAVALGLLTLIRGWIGG
ncbi:MAG: hypothetical protein IT298_12820 [Chloroflexi bacterium]|jgi:hypothetical protein|nr:MAG: hypothetical protein UZ13_02304 [Chloroflexi bacterium OLB13]MBV6437661.1 hypothetical protein [Anaerolineae bacterium]MCC6566636.1 hypothetical protein [Chloroflexota bacterium]OQY83595.1 MAG: hypothetical protein B6D42_07265 [Anaerolineae bacterium UTCFX5]MBW7880850.1 hypothetical protein [Anaerolineae bacterium]